MYGSDDDVDRRTKLMPFTTYWNPVSEAIFLEFWVCFTNILQ